jgi:hypothetical protein
MHNTHSRVDKKSLQTPLFETPNTLNFNSNSGYIQRWAALSSRSRDSRHINTSIVYCQLPSLKHYLSLKGNRNLTI